MKPVITLLIPCLNERRTIARVISDAKKNGRKYLSSVFELVVADNGSTDGTLKLLKKISGIRVIHVPVKGYGAALHWGILNSMGKYIIFADADGSYPFSNLRQFSAILSKKPDLVLGTRLKGTIMPGAMPWLHRYLGTPVLTYLIRFLYRIPVTDCNSGMRLVNKSFYKKLNMRNSGMEWASELLLKTALKKGRFMEVPITFLRDRRLRPPHLTRWADGWRHLKAIVLLKPVSLYPLIVIFFISGFLALSSSFSISFLSFSLVYVLILSLLTLHLLGAAIEKKFTPLDDFIIDFRLIPLTVIFISIFGLLLILLPDTRLGTKLFIVNIIGITFMWIFLVETIKTHLVNRLPDL